MWAHWGRLDTKVQPGNRSFLLRGHPLFFWPNFLNVPMPPGQFYSCSGWFVSALEVMSIRMACGTHAQNGYGADLHIYVTHCHVSLIPLV